MIRSRTERGQKITLLVALYIAQGLPYGFFTLALPVLLRRPGCSLKAISALSLLSTAVAAEVSVGTVRRSSRHAARLAAAPAVLALIAARSCPLAATDRRLDTC